MCGSLLHGLQGSNMREMVQWAMGLVLRGMDKKIEATVAFRV